MKTGFNLLRGSCRQRPAVCSVSSSPGSASVARSRINHPLSKMQEADQPSLCWIDPPLRHMSPSTAAYIPQQNAHSVIRAGMGSYERLTELIPYSMYSARYCLNIQSITDIRTDIRSVNIRNTMESREIAQPRSVMQPAIRGQPTVRAQPFVIRRSIRTQNGTRRSRNSTPAGR